MPGEQQLQEPHYQLQVYLLHEQNEVVSVQNTHRSDLVKKVDSAFCGIIFIVKMSSYRAPLDLVNSKRQFNQVWLVEQLLQNTPRYFSYLLNQLNERVWLFSICLFIIHERPISFFFQSLKNWCCSRISFIFHLFLLLSQLPVGQ